MGVSIQRLAARLRHLASQVWLSVTFRSSGSYWDRRYRFGLTSGAGSRGRAARFKAEFLNEFVMEQGIRSVIEFGCGDGQQLALARYPSYIGLDVSPTAVEMCKRRFSGDPTKSFHLLDAMRTPGVDDSFSADLTISLDVIYHLLEDRIYLNHLTSLFGASRRFVIIYSSDRDEPTHARHVRHRRFTDDVAQGFPQFMPLRIVTNPHRDQSFANFHVYERSDGR